MRDFLKWSRFPDKGRYTNTELEMLLGLDDPAYRVSNEIEALKSLREGRAGPFDCTLPFSWEFSGYSKRDIPYLMHSFRYPGILLVDWWRTGSKDSRDLFLAFVMDWVRAHPSVDLTDSWAWHDDAVARRVSFFCAALFLFERLLTRRQTKDLRQSLEMQSRLLCEESFYKANHNHGMYQDRALALYGLLFSREPEYHLLLARNRARRYFRQVFTPEGVHKEHSPSYHIDMVASITWFFLAYRETDPAFSAEMDSIRHQMAEYIIWITMPDRRIPSIGDSPRFFRSIDSWKNQSNYQWVISAGALGSPPKETMRTFPSAGYGIIRDGWSMDGNGTWMLLLAATHSSAHKHNDDLSFLLYHNGELITEAGNRNYTYSNPMTEYCYSALAHNVVFLNGAGWPTKPNHLPLLDKNAYLTELIDAREDLGVQSVSGIQFRLPGAIQKRSLRFYRDYQVVEVRDEVLLTEPETIQLIYHIAPGIEVQEEGNAWHLLQGEKTAAWIYPSCDDPEREIRLSVIPAETEDMRCAIFHGEETPQYGSLLAFEVDGAVGRNVIRIVVELY